MGLLTKEREREGEGGPLLWRALKPDMAAMLFYDKLGDS